MFSTVISWYLDKKLSNYAHLKRIIIQNKQQSRLEPLFGDTQKNSIIIFRCEPKIETTSLRFRNTSSTSTKTKQLTRNYFLSSKYFRPFFFLEGIAEKNEGGGCGNKQERLGGPVTTRPSLAPRTKARSHGVRSPKC